MILSDKNQSTLKISNENYYSDLSLYFSAVHPNLKDIPKTKDFEAVKQSVKNLILTNFGERPFQSNIGSGVTRYLFEPADTFTIVSMKEDIMKVLKDYEPRVNGVEVSISDDIDRNAFDITIKYNVIFSPNRQEINFALERLR